MSFNQVSGFVMNDNPAHDSITLSQLKSAVNAQAKAKQQYYDFRYDDEDTVMNEIDEFYSYVEAQQFEENLRAWEGSFTGDWTQATYEKRRAHIELLLESLEHKDTEVRFTNARRLFYVLQGTFAETGSAEEQLQWIIDNCKLVRSVDGLPYIVGAIKLASSKHDILYSLSDADAQRHGISANEKQECIEEINTELSVYFGLLYLMIEVLKDHDGFAEELMGLEQPLPVYLFSLVTGLRDKSARGYPVKKLLLIMWKSLLACWGGMRDYNRVRLLSRELAGLSSDKETADPIKSSPFDIQTFRQETSVKYPTFTPPSGQSAPTVSIKKQPLESTTQSHSHQIISVSPIKLAQAYSPIPVRHHYHHNDEYEHQPAVISMQQTSSQMGYQPPMYSTNPQPVTPIPTPPPLSNQKPKKQQYQTDQNRPFLFPFSRGSIIGRSGQFVPFAIDEADKLYFKHLHVSTALFQMWKTREDCMIAESGLQRESGGSFETFESVLNNNSGNAGPSASGSTSSSFARRSARDSTLTEVEESLEELEDVKLLNVKIAETDAELTKIPNDGTRQNIKRIKSLLERKEDLMRLKRVEQIYSAVLSVLPNWVLVLLKLLLATVSASSASQSQPPPSASSSAFPPGVPTPEQQPPPPPPLTKDEIDVIRHREITSKAVSAILYLTMKWFKVSHVMKFHHLGQLLLESNCLLLVLKMFTLQEVSNTVASKADVTEYNFFQFCQSRFGKNKSQTRLEESAISVTQSRPPVARPPSGLSPVDTKADEEIEIITDFSWRNFFSSINFVKIMQKLSKGRSHRIYLLVQYKSSAVLKRMLKVSHPLLQLHVLKLIKSQVPYCGRKWRQSNMKVITLIYLNCRPDLRDEWLAGSEVEDTTEANNQETALRKLVKYYNTKRYGTVVSHSVTQNSHRRNSSVSAPLDGLHPGPELSAVVRPIGTPNMVDTDVFPPLRAQAQDPSIFLPYATEDIAFEDEYEEYITHLGMSDDHITEGQLLFGGTSAWHRLPHMGPDIGDGISDSESIASIGELVDESKFDATAVESDRESIDENRNNWEHMSPKTMAALPKSPVGVHRRSSSGSSLRPVLPFGLDDGSAIDLENEEEPEMGPMPREQTSPFASGAGVDEVEYAYGL